MFAKKGFAHMYSTIALIVMIGLGGVILFAQAANQDQIFISTPTHAEAYDLEVNGTLKLYRDGTQTCNATTNGTLYYDGDDHYACDGSSWKSITQSGGVGTDDQTLSWNDATNILSIEDGNSVNLTNLSGEGGTSDHGALTGLADDDHPQYLNQARFDSNTSGWDTDASDDYDSADFSTDFGTKTTDDLTEGSTNLYDDTTWNKTYADTLYSTGAHYTDSDIDGNEAAFTGWDKDASNDLTLSQVASNVGNWSADSSSYYTSAQVDTELALQDDCSEINGCVEGAVTTSDDTVSWSEISGIVGTTSTSVARGDLDDADFDTEGDLTALLDDNYADISVTGDNASWNESHADSKYSTGAHYSDSDIDGTETAFDGWDKNAGDDITDHGALTGLADDDHTQYMNQARFDSNTSGWDTNAGDDFDGLYESLTGAVPTHLSNFTDNLGHVEESTTAGTGLNLATYELSVLLAYRLPQSCANGQIAEYNTSSGGWDCANDDQAASGMSNWVLAAESTGGSETITEGETVTMDVGSSGYLTANRSTNFIYYNFNSTLLDANYVGQTEYPNLDTDSTNDALPGTCGAGTVVQNTTTSGVQCITDANTQLSEAQVEAMIFDDDNTGTLETTGNLVFNSWAEGNTGISMSEVTDDLTLTANVTGSNVFTIATTGTFLEMIANPGAGNGYVMFSFAETQGAETYLNFYEGGTGHNRLWDSGSARFGGNAGYLCSELTSDVDCDTSGTGADVVVQDDIWAGGKLFASDWTNVTITESQISDLTHYTSSNFNTDFSGKSTDDLSQGSTNLYDNTSWNQTHADTLYSTGAHTTDTNASNCATGQLLDGDNNCVNIDGLHDSEYVELTDGHTNSGGDVTVTGAYNALVLTIGHDALDDQYYDSEADLTTLLDDNYAEDGANSDITSMSGLTGEVKTSSFVNYTMADGNVQTFNQGCVMKSNSTGIHFIC